MKEVRTSTDKGKQYTVNSLLSFPGGGLIGFKHSRGGLTGEGVIREREL